MKKVSILGVAAMAIGLALPVEEAMAQRPTHACACLINKTRAKVNFRYKWGDSDWREDYLQAGNQETLCWRFEGGSTLSPKLGFQIDVDLSDRTAWTTYNIPLVQTVGNRCNAVDTRHHYDINYRANTNNQFLDVTHR